MKARVWGRAPAVAALLIAAACCAGAFPAPAGAVSARPCDIYALGGTPCVAAFSTTRALYAAYHGPLYEVQRVSDGATSSIWDLRSGYADAGSQDRFCTGTTCEITVVFDQSPNHNNLTVEGPGGAGGQDVGVVATTLAVTVGGHPAYGMYFGRETGYRDDSTTGVATGAQPESIYMVASGTHTNSRCCFDFGNAETDGIDNGNGHMDAVYLGSECFPAWPTCYGRGPWVQADLENGLFMSDVGNSQRPGYTGSTSPFVTAMLKNNGVTAFALMQANAQSGHLASIWSGPLPQQSPDGGVPITGQPMETWAPLHKEGAIVLGTGGDNSNRAVGSFFEGVMTAGYASNATEAAVQANIVAAHYRPAKSGAPVRKRPHRSAIRG